MYRQSLLLVLLGLGLATSQAALAAQALSLEEALQTGVKNSPAIQKAEAKRDEGKWKGMEGLSVFLPNVKVSAAHYFEKRYQLLDVPFNGINAEIPQIFPTSSATLDAKWLLFDGLQNVEFYKGAQAFKASAESNYQWVNFLAAHEVVLTYYKVVAARKLEEVANQNLKTLQDHGVQVKNLKSGGLATNYDVLRVESQLSEAQADLLQAQDNTVIAQENLARVLGVSDAVDVTETELAVPAAESVKNLTFNRNTNKRLDLQSLEQEVEATDYIQSGQSRFFVPKVYLGAEYSKYNNLTDTLSDWKNYRSSWNVGFMLSWDIFNPREFAQSKEQYYHSLQTQKTLVESNLQAPVDFAFWKKRYVYSATLYQAKKIDADRASETVRLAHAGFKAGVRTTSEVLDAELELFRARAGIVNAQMNCIEAKQKLELSLGETL
jgi:outer membrane protein TolC